MNTRKGLGKGMGMGYKNLINYDPYVHSLSAKGVKSYPNITKLFTPKFIQTKGNEKISITCANCGYKIKDFKNIFEGQQTSYICPRCQYEGFAYPSNTKFYAKGKKYSRQDYKELKELEIRKENLLKKMDIVTGNELDEVEDEYDDVLEKISYIKRGRKGYPDEEEQYWEDRAEAEAVARESGGYISSNAKGKKLNAIGKVWTQVVRKILPHETRVRGKIANTLRDDEIETILATMEFFGASDQVIAQAHSDMKIPRYRMGGWLGMFVQNEGYDKVGGETATKVLAHAYIKADGDIDKMIQDLRETDYQVDTSWEKIDLREV